MDHTDEELRALSSHVLWHVRQLCRLGGGLDQRQKQGTSVMLAPTDAATLEAFLLHARALTEFLWRSRSDKPKPRKTDGLAEDYFGPGRWQPFEKPQRLNDMMRRVGSGVIHVSYKRLDPDEAWGWDFGWIGVALFSQMELFVRCVPAERVAADFADATHREFQDHFGIKGTKAILKLGWFGRPVGTPGHAAAHLWEPIEPPKQPKT
jgi:hypothetical protein